MGVKSLNRAPLLRDTLCPVHGVAAWAKLRVAGVWGGAGAVAASQIQHRAVLVGMGFPQNGLAHAAPHHFIDSAGRASAALLLQLARTRASPSAQPPSTPPGIGCKAKRSATPGRAGGGQL